MNVREILENFLRAGGYDGLCNLNNECACETDDLFPCDFSGIDCEPGHRVPCDCGDHDWHINPGHAPKEEVKDV